MKEMENREGSSRYPLVGAHMSIAGGIWKSIFLAEEEGCTSVQIFTKNPNRWESPPLTKGDALRFRQAVKRRKISPIVAHDSYLVNLASPAAALRARSRQAFLEELKRCELLEISCLITHPGSHTGSGVEAGLRRVAESLDWVHDRAAGFKVKVCLENTAGQGSVLGGDFGHLGEILARVKEPDRIGVCFDTCHAFAAGYDMREEEGYEKVMKLLEEVLGPGRILVVHANDAKGELGAHLDRHAHLGRGMIGLEGFRLLMNDGRLRDAPKILETPKEEGDLPMDRVNLALLRALSGTEKVPEGLIERVEEEVRQDHRKADLSSSPPSRGEV